MMKLWLRCAAVVSYGVVGSAIAADAVPVDESSLSKTQVGGQQDKGFVIKASQAGHQEVADAQLALKKSLRPEIKQVAAMLEKDHAEAGAKLSMIVKKNGWNIPEAAALAQGKPVESAYSDEQYLASQLAAHQDAIALFRRESSEGADADLKAFAADAVPTLERHLAAIQALAKAN